MIEASTCLIEALMLHLLRQNKPGIDAPAELEILDLDMRSYGQWRLIFWLRPLPGSKIHDRLGGNIRTVVVHQGSFVEIVADAPMPSVSGA